MSTMPHRNVSSPSPRKNPYAAHAKVDEALLLSMARRFVRGDTASEAAKTLAVNRNTANRYYQIFRNTLACHDGQEMPLPPEGPPIIGMFLTAATVQARLVPEEHRDLALCALRARGDGKKAMAVASSPGWPGYDALGDPGEGRFALMPCCLVGQAGQERLAVYWLGLRERLCRCRGIPRVGYPQHLLTCDMAQNLGPDKLLEKLLAALRGLADISSP